MQNPLDVGLYSFIVAIPDLQTQFKRTQVHLFRASFPPVVYSVRSWRCADSERRSMIRSSRPSTPSAVSSTNPSSFLAHVLVLDGFVSTKPAPLASIALNSASAIVIQKVGEPPLPCPVPNMAYDSVGPYSSETPWVVLIW